MANQKNYKQTFGDIATITYGNFHRPKAKKPNLQKKLISEDKTIIASEMIKQEFDNSNNLAESKKITEVISHNIIDDLEKSDMRKDTLLNTDSSGSSSETDTASPILNKKNIGQKIAILAYETARFPVMAILLTAKLVIQIAINILSFLVGLVCAIFKNIIEIGLSVFSFTAKQATRDKYEISTIPQALCNSANNVVEIFSSLSSIIGTETTQHIHALADFDKDGGRNDLNALKTFNFTNYSEPKNLRTGVVSIA